MCTPNFRFLLLSGCIDGSINMWDMSTGEFVRTIDTKQYISSRSTSPVDIEANSRKSHTVTALFASPLNKNEVIFGVDNCRSLFSISKLVSLSANNTAAVQAIS